MSFELIDNLLKRCLSPQGQMSAIIKCLNIMMYLKTLFYTQSCKTSNPYAVI